MTQVIGAFDAKTHFAELLKKVEQGEQVIITRHGKQIAKLSPMQVINKENSKSVINDLLNFSASHTLGDLTWKELRDEGRKY